jgi:hypothetical protein
MEIQEIENPNNKKLKIKPVKYTSDDIDDTIPYPLPQTFAWMMYLVGRPKSGKTVFLLNLIAKRGKFYNKKFDLIYVFSPSIFSGNLKDNPLDALPPDQKHTDLDKLEEVIQQIYGSDQRVLFIFDDIQHFLKGENLKTFLHLINNRRHYTSGGCSIILTSQNYIGQVDLKIRKSISHLVFWSSKNKKEIDAVHSEFLSFLDDKEMRELLAYVWEKTHDFLYLDTYQSQDKMIFKNFNQILLKTKNTL